MGSVTQTSDTASMLTFTFTDNVHEGQVRTVGARSIIWAGCTSSTDNSAAFHQQKSFRTPPRHDRFLPSDRQRHRRPIDDHLGRGCNLALRFAAVSDNRRSRRGNGAARGALVCWVTHASAWRRPLRISPRARAFDLASIARLSDGRSTPSDNPVHVVLRDSRSSPPVKIASRTKLLVACGNKGVTWIDVSQGALVPAAIF